MMSKSKRQKVGVIDSETKEEMEFYAKVIFVNAGTLNTALLLLNSTSSRFSRGFGNDSGALGHYLMNHNYRGQLGASYEGFYDQYYSGRRPAGVSYRVIEMWKRYSENLYSWLRICCR